jgi:hypothetical protein
LDVALPFPLDDELDFEVLHVLTISHFARRSSQWIEK